MTLKQARFVEEYLIDLNATQAAIRAGYSARTAEWIGPQLLKKTHVHEAVEKGRMAQTERSGLTADMVLSSIVRELTFDPACCFNQDGSLKQIHEMDPDTRMVLSSVETVQIGSLDAPVFIRKVKWIQPGQAREQAMKHLGLFKAGNDQDKPKSEQITQIVLVAVRPEPGRVIDG